MSGNDGFQNDKTKKSPLQEQVLEEFVDAADRGTAGRQRSSDPNDTLPTPLDTKDDAAWANISVEQIGEAVGLVYQDDEPLNTIEKMEERDDNRWSMDPASAENSDETSN